MNELGKVVLRTPEVFTALEAHGTYYVTTGYDNWRTFGGEEDGVDGFDSVFVHIDVAADLAWNAVIRELIEETDIWIRDADPEGKVYIGRLMIHRVALGKHIRPIATTEGEGK